MRSLGSACFRRSRAISAQPHHISSLADAMEKEMFDLCLSINQIWFTECSDASSGSLVLSCMVRYQLLIFLISHWGPTLLHHLHLARTCGDEAHPSCFLDVALAWHGRTNRPIVLSLVLSAKYRLYPRSFPTKIRQDFSGYGTAQL